MQRRTFRLCCAVVLGRSILKFFLIITGILVFFVVLGIIDRIRKKRERYEKVKRSFGVKPTETMSSERYQSLKVYLNSLPAGSTDIDEITWNDLEMEHIFAELNHTCSAVGEEVLFAYLHKPQTDGRELAEREKLISLFEKKEDVRVETGVALLTMGKMRRISVYDYIMRLHSVPKEENAKHYAALFLYAVSVALMIFGFSGYGIGLFFAVAMWNTTTYLKRKGQIQPYLDAVSYISRLVRQTDGLAERLSAEDDPVLCRMTEDIRKDTAQLRNFVFGASFLSADNPTGGDLMELVMDYIRMIFHIDLIQFNRIYRTFESKQEELNRLFAATGKIDAMRAVASYRTYRKNYAIPVFHEEVQHSLKVCGICHPLVENPVANSIAANRPVLLTGSNASGKSTFLKTLAVNAILAQTIHTVIAESYEADYFRVLSSMALRDDLAAKESYYIVEIRSLKRILEAAEDHNTSVLCFVDEVLRGTNTAERIAASSRILRYLAEQEALVFAATHDLELTGMLADVYDNYHFSENVSEEAVTFDYMLKPGKATSRNALKLLAMMDYPKKITEDANIAVEHFLATGEWKVREG